METSMNNYHEPVLLRQSIEGLNIHPNGMYVDVTFGSGGHSRAILQKLGPNGQLIAFDQDEDALQNTIEDKRFTLTQANFKNLKKFLKLYQIEKVDGILADLGVSSHQFDDETRGFSIRWDGLLDMRMDKRKPLKATDILSDYEPNELLRIFRQYGEVENAKKLTMTIVNIREQVKITYSKQFIEIIKDCIPKQKENKYLAQVYQALRIEVNEELLALQNLLQQSMEVLTANGRLVVISYHSLEDRMVKHFMRSGNFENRIDKDFFGNLLTPFHLISRKAIVPDEKELTKNPRSRSAKLRIAEKK
ncbi:MAG: 16S rRNA (cytosine(1402)-N(4))-methyltransferase RsmH [Bacteroidales bacterium]|nr:16S rRNA (cytosine(1402)-N(4))-methyltransferase RsmH [Bacteroidales bacterium]MDD4210424.1 16S rRNA (cytosine(1402)-N(4))-methyltransferase RsmH [Bacteroidales bacterium]